MRKERKEEKETNLLILIPLNDDVTTALFYHFMFSSSSLRFWLFIVPHHSNQIQKNCCCCFFLSLLFLILAFKPSPSVYNLPVIVLFSYQFLIHSSLCELLEPLLLLLLYSPLFYIIHTNGSCKYIFNFFLPSTSFIRLYKNVFMFHQPVFRRNNNNIKAQSASETSTQK